MPLSEQQQKIIDGAREKLSSIKLLRTRAILNAGLVTGGDPKKQFSWVNNSQDRIKYYEGLEYRVSKDAGIKEAHPDWVKEDGTIRRGDLILMEVERDIYEGIKYSELLDAAENRDQAERIFLNYAERNGVPTFQPKTSD